MIKVYSPGRAELLGNHTDYNEGFVLAIAVNRGTTVEGQTRSDRKVRLTAHDLGETFETSLDQIKPVTQQTWANYVLGVVAQMQRAGHALGGFDLAISSNLPMGAGLSSSAALEIATALFLQKAFGFSLSPLETAKAGQKAEHEFTGVKCGLLDQIAVLFGREDAVTFIDCRSYEVKTVPIPHDIAFIVANSNVKHALVGGEYNERREDCEAAAHALGVPFLRDVDRATLEKNRGKMNDRQFRRALHVVGENERVLAGIKALESNNAAAFGKLMYESHESSRFNFENSCQELDELVEAAQKIKGCQGARLSGGGFGGATINAVNSGLKDAFVEDLKKAYPPASCLITTACAGARVI